MKKKRLLVDSERSTAAGKPARKTPAIRLSLSNIAAIAYYERKSIQRSWFFRICALLVLAGIGAYCLLSYIHEFTLVWYYRAIGWGLPYEPMVLLSVVQSFVVIFLAAGLMKRSKKLDTSEVFMSRPISNTEHVLGRVWALLGLLMAACIIILLEVLLLAIAVPDTVVKPLAYVVYPLLIVLPNFVFIVGISFLTVSLIKNQAVSLVILLGLNIMGMIYLRDNYLFPFLGDYVGMKLPMMFSDMTGFSDYGHLLMQRSIFLLLGLCFLCVSILLVDRLPRNGFGQPFAAMMALLCMAGAVVMAYSYLDRVHWRVEAQRQQSLRLNNNYGAQDNISIDKTKINLTHKGKTIDCEVELSISNPLASDLSQVILFLNPSLSLSELTHDNQALTYERDYQVIKAELPKPLPAGQSTAITLKYSGSISEAIAFPLAEESTRRYYRERKLNRIPKRHSFLMDNYVLLIREVLWYPVARPNSRSDRQMSLDRHFQDFELEVNTKPGMTAISQGAVEQRGSSFSFKPEQPLTQLSLAIGRYKKQSIAVDSVDYELYVHQGHDYYAAYFDVVADTLAEVIRQVKGDLEKTLSLDYPFRRLRLVETPVHFEVYRHLAANHYDYLQPATIYLPEKGGRVVWTNFERIRAFQQLRMQNRPDKELQFGMAKQSIVRLFTPYKGGLNNFSHHSVSNNYFWFANTLTSEPWPFVDKLISSYLKPREPREPYYKRYEGGLNLSERVNRRTIGKTMQEVLNSNEQYFIKNQLILDRSELFFTILEDNIGQNEFGDFLRAFISNHRFENTSLDQLADSLRTAHGLDLQPIMEQVYAQREVPVYEISKPEIFEVSSDELPHYQYKTTISNVSDQNGIVIFNYIGQGSRLNEQTGMVVTYYTGYTGQSPSKDIVPVAARQTKEVYAVFDYKPTISINTLVSRNLPISYGFNPQELNVTKGGSLFDGEKIVDKPPARAANEIIVDNEDEGFSLESDLQESLLDRLMSSKESGEKGYTDIFRSHDENTWVKAMGGGFYGDHIKSAHVIRPGKGLQRAIWSTEIKQSGYYDIYAYVNKIELDSWSSVPKQEKAADHYKVYHDEGVEEVNIDTSFAGKGWVHLGAYYLSRGETKVELSDRRDDGSNFVAADAVKWVRQQE